MDRRPVYTHRATTPHHTSLLLFPVQLFQSIGVHGSVLARKTCLTRGRVGGLGGLGGGHRLLGSYVSYNLSHFIYGGMSVEYGMRCLYIYDHCKFRPQLSPYQLSHQPEGNQPTP